MMSMKSRFRPYLAAALVAAAIPAASLPAPAMAQATQAQQDEALTFLTGVSDVAFAVLRDPSMKKEAQLTRFRELFKEVTAVDKIGPLLLGHYSRQLNEEQLRRYTAVLPDYVVQLYTDRILAVGDEELTILGTYAQGRKDTWVKSELTSPLGGSPLRADWRIRKLENGEFTLLDMKVENISLFQTKKDEFMAFIDRNGLDAFVERIEKDSRRTAS